MVKRTDYVSHQGESPLDRLTVDVGAGADGSFALYEDAGEGHGYRSGQSATTRLSWNDGERTLTVGAVQGGYPGLVGSRSYTLRLHAAAAPTSVSVDGQRVPETSWTYNQYARTVTVWTTRLSTTAAHTVRLNGSAAANPAGGAVIGNGDLCLDVSGGSSQNGQRIQLSDCNGTAAQQWSHRPDRSLHALDRCLDVRGAGTANGTPVQLCDCNGTSAQVWVSESDGTLRNPGSGRCLEAQNGGASDGTPVQLWDCDDVAAMNWKLPPGPIVGPGGKCIDVLDADPASGTPVQLFSCNGTDAQRWYVPGDGTIRSFGKCLDVVGARTANGTPVQLWDCNGTPAQQWVSRPDGTLRNPASGRCLDVPGNRQADLDRLQIYDCNASAAQRWTLPEPSPSPNFLAGGPAQPSGGASPAGRSGRRNPALAVVGVAVPDVQRRGPSACASTAARRCLRSPAIRRHSATAPARRGTPTGASCPWSPRPSASCPGAASRRRSSRAARRSRRSRAARSTRRRTAGSPAPSSTRADPGFTGTGYADFADASHRAAYVESRINVEAGMRTSRARAR